MKARLMNPLYILIGLLLALALLSVPVQANDNHSILKNRNTIDTISSTVPANGDVNPYGLVRVSRSIGNLREGHYLVSNFNASSNLQGTGTTIVDVSPSGSLSVFAQLSSNSLPGLCPGGVGLTTALAVLQTGWVIVGSLPTADGTSATAQAGCLIVLANLGNPVETIQGSLVHRPLVITWLDNEQQAAPFFPNVLNETVAADVTLINPRTCPHFTL